MTQLNLDVICKDKESLYPFLMNRFERKLTHDLQSFIDTTCLEFGRLIKEALAFQPKAESATAVSPDNKKPLEE